MAGEQSPAESGGDRVVELDCDDCGDGVVGVDEAEGGACGVEGLGYYDTADDGGVNFWRQVVDEEMGAAGVAPAPINEHAEDQNVDPVN